MFLKTISLFMSCVAQIQIAAGRTGSPPNPLPWIHHILGTVNFNYNDCSDDRTESVGNWSVYFPYSKSRWLKMSESWYFLLKAVQAVLLVVVHATIGSVRMISIMRTAHACLVMDLESIHAWTMFTKMGHVKFSPSLSPLQVFPYSNCLHPAPKHLVLDVL